jgi:hypothetical protein
MTHFMLRPSESAYGGLGKPRQQASSPAINKERAIKNGQNKNMKTRYSRPRPPYVDRSKRRSSNSSRPEPKSPHDAQRNYERYLALAQAEAQSGNSIGAENYYQHAEHYFRSMASDREAT